MTGVQTCALPISYVNTLTKNNVPLPAATTVIGFADKTSFPVLTFEFGGLLGEKELGQIMPMIESEDVLAIVDASAPAISTVAPALSTKPAPAVEDAPFGFDTAPVEEPAKPKKERALKAVKEEPAPVQEPASDDTSDADLAAMLGISL